MVVLEWGDAKYLLISDWTRYGYNYCVAKMNTMFYMVVTGGAGWPVQRCSWLWSDHYKRETITALAEMARRCARTAGATAAGPEPESRTSS